MTAHLSTTWVWLCGLVSFRRATLVGLLIFLYFVTMSHAPDDELPASGPSTAFHYAASRLRFLRQDDIVDEKLLSPRSRKELPWHDKYNTWIFTESAHTSSTRLDLLTMCKYNLHLISDLWLIRAYHARRPQMLKPSMIRSMETTPHESMINNTLIVSEGDYGGCNAL